jgi:hypothetical protein
VRFRVLTAASTKVTVFWDVSYGLVGVDWRCRGAYCSHRRGDENLLDNSTWMYIPYAKEHFLSDCTRAVVVRISFKVPYTDWIPTVSSIHPQECQSNTLNRAIISSSPIHSSSPCMFFFSVLLSGSLISGWSSLCFPRDKSSFTVKKLHLALFLKLIANFFIYNITYLEMTNYCSTFWDINIEISTNYYVF